MVNPLGVRTIKSIPVMPFAMMLGVISAVIGLIIAIICALVFGAIISAIPPTTTYPVPATIEFANIGWLNVLFNVGAIIIMPILGFIVGLIQGVIYAVLYNFLAPRIGGIKLCFKEEDYIPPQS